jgi:hypothetical protein
VHTVRRMVRSVQSNLGNAQLQVMQVARFIMAPNRCRSSVQCCTGPKVMLLGMDPKWDMISLLPSTMMASDDK